MLLHEATKESDDHDMTSATEATDQLVVLSLDALPEIPNVLILYGSQTGNAEAAARRMKRGLRQVKPKIMTLNDAKGLTVVQKNKITRLLNFWGWKPSGKRRRILSNKTARL